MAGVPYYQPVAAVTPEVDHTAAKIIANSDLAGSYTRGLAAMGHIAAANKQMQLEAEKDAVAASLRSRELDIQRENNFYDHEVGMKNAEAYADSRRVDTEYKTTVINAEKDRRRSAYLDNIDFQKSLASIRNQAREEANSYQLFDPKFQTQNPVDFAANVKHFEEHWSTAPPSLGIQAEIAKLKTIRDQQKIELPFPEGKRTIPIWQVAEGLQNEKTHDLFKQALIDSGQITVDQVPTEARTSTWKRPIDSLWDKFVKGKAPTKPVEKVSSYIQDYVTGKDKFAPESSKVGHFVPRSSRAYMMDQAYNRPEEAAPSITQESVDEASAAMGNEAALPVDEIIQPTDTDKEVTKAKLAIARANGNPDAIRSIREHFASKGYDESLLDQ